MMHERTVKANSENFELKNATGQGSEAWRTSEMLKRRAEVLARVPDYGEGNEGGISVLQFRLASESYALSTKSIRQVIRAKEITPLPHTPAFVPGIINVRGEVISLIDFREIFDLQKNEEKGAAFVMIVSNESMQFGIVADEIMNVIHVLPEELQQTLPTLTDVRERYLMGVTREGLVVLDCEKVLNDEKLRVA